MPTRASVLQAFGRGSTLTFQITDEGDGLDGVATVGEGLDDVVLHDAQHAEAPVVACHMEGAALGQELSQELSMTPPN